MLALDLPRLLNGRPWRSNSLCPKKGWHVFDHLLGNLALCRQGPTEPIDAWQREQPLDRTCHLHLLRRCPHHEEKWWAISGAWQHSDAC